MEYAYDEIWLSDAVVSQGVMFALVADTHPDIDMEAFIVKWMHSLIRKDMDIGCPRYVCSPGPELLRDYLREEPNAFTPGMCHMDFDMARWVGRFYSYSQWYWNIPSSELVTLIPPDLLGVMYPGMHDKSLAVAVREWNPREDSGQLG